MIKLSSSIFLKEITHHLDALYEQLTHYQLPHNSANAKKNNNSEVDFSKTLQRITYDVHALKGILGVAEYKELQQFLHLEEDKIKIVSKESELINLVTNIILKVANACSIEKYVDFNFTQKNLCPLSIKKNEPPTTFTHQEELKNYFELSLSNFLNSTRCPLKHFLRAV